MTVDDVLALVRAARNPRGEANWAEHCGGSGLTSYGVGLTVLRKLAKQVGRDHVLAAELWKSDCYEARVISLLIDDPKKLTRATAEAQVEDLAHGMLVHVFSSCDATLAKTPFAADLAVEWTRSSDDVRKRCGYGLLYEVSKDKRKSAPDEAYFLDQIDHIRENHHGESRQVRMAMGGALMGIGKRTRMLNAAALALVREMGPLEGEPGCEPFDVEKHLTSDYLTKKLGL